MQRTTCRRTRSRPPMRKPIRRTRASRVRRSARRRRGGGRSPTSADAGGGSAGASGRTGLPRVFGLQRPAGQAQRRRRRASRHPGRPTGTGASGARSCPRACSCVHRRRATDGRPPLREDPAARRGRPRAEAHDPANWWSIYAVRGAPPDHVQTMIDEALRHPARRGHGALRNAICVEPPAIVRICVESGHFRVEKKTRSSPHRGLRA
jgi:hypothetical protein